MRRVSRDESASRAPFLVGSRSLDEARSPRLQSVRISDSLRANGPGHGVGQGLQLGQSQLPQEVMQLLNVA
jgi:hypothetical protein